MMNPSVQAVGAAQTGGAPQFASLYVGDLDPDVTEAMLYEIFNTVGPVASIRVCRDSVTRRSLGYAYVNFHSSTDAERVMDTLNYSTIKNRCCRIMWSHRDPNLRKTGNGNVFVKNLDKNVDNKALYDTFSLFGNILSCKVATDGEGKSKGYGFVHYETPESAKQAIEKVNNMQIGEKTVFVGEFVARDGRSPAEITNFTNIYCKNYPADWEEERLEAEFQKYGQITSSMCQKDKKGRPFAFLNFEKPEEAAAAIAALHGKDLRDEEEKAAAPFGRDAKGEPLLEKPAETSAESAETAAGGEEGEKKEGEEGEGAEGSKEAEHHPEHLLFVSRAMTKAEREAMLRQKFKQAGGNAPVGVNLYIKNLPDDCDDGALREMFATFGDITSARVMTDASKRSKGFGFVCYKTPEEATKAVSEMHLKTVKGKPLYVGLAEKKDARVSRLSQRYKGEKGLMNMGPGMMGGKGMGGGPGMMGQGGPGMGMGGMGKDGKGGMMPGMYGGGGYNMGAGKGGMMGPGGPRGPMGGPMNPMNPMAAGRGPMGPGGPMGGPMGGMGPGYPGMNPMMKGMAMNPMMGQKGMNPMMAGQKGMNPMGAPMGGPMGPIGPQMGGPMGPGGVQQMGGPGMRQMGVPGGQMGGQFQGGSGLTAAALASAPSGMQKQMLGEKLYPAVSRLQPELAGKITGMMLEMDNTEVLMMLDSEQQLRSKVDEAVRVLNQLK